MQHDKNPIFVFFLAGKSDFYMLLCVYVCNLFWSAFTLIWNGVRFYRAQAFTCSDFGWTIVIYIYNVALEYWTSISGYILHPNWMLVATERIKMSQRMVKWNGLHVNYEKYPIEYLF